MARKRYKPEEIVAKLRQVDVLVSPRPVNDGRDPPDRRELSNLLSVAPRVRRAPDRASEADEGDRTREQPAAQSGVRPDAGQAHPPGSCAGKLLSPARRRACIEQVRAQLHVSERRACAALGQHRSTQRKVPRGREDEERLTADIIELGSTIRPLRLSQDRRAASSGGLDDQRQAGRAHLATRGAQSPAQTAQARQALADRRSPTSFSPWNSLGPT